METKYPALRRPKRKLCYLTNKESQSEQWTGRLSLGDVDRMFDDMDPSTHSDENMFPPSLLLQTSDTDTNQPEREASPHTQKVQPTEKPPECQMGSDGDALHPAITSPSHKLVIDLGSPFKVHRPVKTSSPIEGNIVLEGEEEPDPVKDLVVSPILISCEDEVKEETKKEPPHTQKPQCNGHVPDESEDYEMESPPSKVALSKPKISSHKNQESCKERLPAKQNSPMKPQKPVLEDKKTKTQRQENTEPPALAVSQEPELTAPKKKSENLTWQPVVDLSTRGGKDMTAFLQKLRDAGQPKPACSRKSLSPVKIPTPSEPEDDFLILEDDAPLWFSIPSKTVTSKKQGQSRTSSTDKDSSTDKGKKDSPITTAPEQESETVNDKLESQTVNQKMRKMKGKAKKNEVTEPRNDENELCIPEDLPADDLLEQEEPNKKNLKRPKKMPPKEKDKAEVPSKDTASRETDEEKLAPKMESKAQKASDTKRSKSLRDENENAKKGRAKSLKGARKVPQRSDAVKEMVQAAKEQTQEQSSTQEHTDAADLGSVSEEEIMKSQAQIDGKEKLNKPPAEAEDGQVLVKRKRKQAGQWWVSCPDSREETKVSDKQPTPKKSKQANREPHAAAPSPLKAKNSKVLKTKTQTPAPLPSRQNTNKAKVKKSNRKKNMTVIEAEQIEEQQQQQQQPVPDQDLDPSQSSPVVLVCRDHSLNSGDKVFQRVYHHVSNEKMPTTPTPVSPRGPREQLAVAERERRRRKCPGNWWELNGLSEAVESISSQPQQQEPKLCKERRKQPRQSRSPRLGTPKNGNTAVASKPRGGAPVTQLNVQPLSAPKSVKRSLATFKDIFSSVAETPAVVSSREAGQKNRRKVHARPAEEITVTEYTTQGETVTHREILSMDAGESSSPPNQENLQDSKCQSENTLQAHRSGPSSMIELEQYEENDDLILPSSRVHTVLSASDLCAPPLKPLVLQPKDKANLTEWFKSLWATAVGDSPEITPDEFDWYFYQGRAIGFLVDLNCDSFCNGKILLGSYMKKPLWVDHSATTVFNLLTSSVKVIINSCESHYNPGGSFMVPCGHAYSIQNVSAQPAVLYFTRILAESSD